MEFVIGAVIVAVLAGGAMGYFFAIPLLCFITLGLFFFFILTWAREMRAAKKGNRRGSGYTGAILAGGVITAAVAVMIVIAWGVALYFRKDMVTETVINMWIFFKPYLFR